MELVQKVAEFLKVDPVMLLTTQPGSVIESINNSPITGSNSGIGNSVGGDLNERDEKQNEMMMKLMENVVRLSEKVIEMMEKRVRENSVFFDLLRKGIFAFGIRQDEYPSGFFSYNIYNHTD